MISNNLKYILHMSHTTTLLFPNLSLFLDFMLSSRFWGGGDMRNVHNQVAVAPTPFICLILSLYLRSNYCKHHLPCLVYRNHTLVPLYILWKFHTDTYQFGIGQHLNFTHAE